MFTANVIIFMSTVEWKRNDTNWTRTHVLLSTFITRCPTALTDNLYVTCTKKRRSKRQWREHSMGNVEHGNLFILSLKVNKQHTKPKASLLPHLQKLSNDRLPVGVCILIWQSSSINLGRIATPLLLFLYSMLRKWTQNHRLYSLMKESMHIGVKLRVFMLLTQKAS